MSEYLNGIKDLKKLLKDTYENPILRRTIVPLIMSNPGLGKSTTVHEFAKEMGVNILPTILSTRMPNEVAGGSVPNYELKCWEILNNSELENLKDGDIWFIDEVFNGTLKQTLDSLLNVLESRTLLSGKKLADIMIMTASNPQGLMHITPQIAERFLMYKLRFNKEEYQDRMKERYGMPFIISKHLCLLIEKEKFETTKIWNYNSARSLEKAITQIGSGSDSPYEDLLLPYLKEKITCPTTIESIGINSGDEVEYLELLKFILKEKNDLERNLTLKVIQ